MVTNILILLAVAVGAWLIGWWTRGEKVSSQHISKEFLRHLREKLEDLRNQVPGNSGWGSNIKKSVAEGRLSYEVLGTTEEELERLGRRLEAKQGALNLLSWLRRGNHDYEKYLKLLPERLTEAGLTLEDIGSTAQEFAAFADNNKKILAKEHLHELRDKLRFASVDAQWLLHFKNKGVKPVEIGLSQKKDSVLPVLADLT